MTVVPYIGTWIETLQTYKDKEEKEVVPYIGTWIETTRLTKTVNAYLSRTLYRYVD